RAVGGKTGGEPVTGLALGILDPARQLDERAIAAVGDRDVTTDNRAGPELQREIEPARRDRKGGSLAGLARDAGRREEEQQNSAAPETGHSDPIHDLSPALLDRSDHAEILQSLGSVHRVASTRTRNTSNLMRSESSCAPRSTDRWLLSAVSTARVSSWNRAVDMPAVLAPTEPRPVSRPPAPAGGACRSVPLPLRVAAP